jgi:hypothetical protein
VAPASTTCAERSARAFAYNVSCESSKLLAASTDEFAHGVQKRNDGRFFPVHNCSALLQRSARCVALAQPAAHAATQIHCWSLLLLTLPQSMALAAALAAVLAHRCVCCSTAKIATACMWWNLVAKNWLVAMVMGVVRVQLPQSVPFDRRMLKQAPVIDESVRLPQPAHAQEPPCTAYSSKRSCLKSEQPKLVSNTSTFDMQYDVKHWW